DTAGTVKVSVQLPQDHPFIHVSTKPITGWTAVAAEKPLPKPVDYEGTTITKAVRTVTWTADQGTQIRPNEYQEFSISVGPLPEPGTVMLPATQTYSDGTVVAWDQPTPDSAEEPDKPAPEFNVVAAAAGADHGGPTSSDPNAEALSTENSTSTETTAPAAADPVARTLGGLGLAAGLGGLVLGGLALRRRSAGGASS
ncbi:MAG: YcnI family protein, partial [Microlunatus sp.]|nr:YcnI family protein [Microlunatus sp.]